MSVPAHRTVKKQIYSDNSDIEITFTLTIRRKTLFYTFNLSKNITFFKSEDQKNLCSFERSIRYQKNPPNF